MESNPTELIEKIFAIRDSYHKYVNSGGNIGKPKACAMEEALKLFPSPGSGSVGEAADT